MRTITRENLNMSTPSKWFALLLSLLTLGLTGCGGENSFFSDGTTTTTTTSDTVASKLVVSTNKISIQSGTAEFATIKVQAVDANNALVEGVLVSFSATAGTITSSSGITDANGEVNIDFYSVSDVSNQTATITASSSTASSVSIPVQISGSSVTLNSIDSVLIAGTVDDTTKITATAQDSTGTVVFNTPVTISIDSVASTSIGQLLDSTGAAVQSYTANTDVTGKLVLKVKGLTTGSLTVTATGLGVTTSLTLLVKGNTTALQITSPATATAFSINAAQSISVYVPAGVTSVSLSSTIGTFTSSGTSLATRAVVGPATITEQITASTVGTATVTVFETSNIAVADTISMVFVNNAVDVNSKVNLQASLASVPVSSGGQQYSTTLFATVKDINGDAIANAPIGFTLENPTGGGEYITPGFAITGADGTIVVTFYSGTLASDSNGVRVKGSLYAGTTVIHSSSVDIVINQTAGSVVIGESTTMRSSNDNTAYILPVSVQVLDSLNAAVPGAVVSLRAWPINYYTGYRDDKCTPIITGAYPNEDLNKNLILDANEEKNNPIVEGDYWSTDGTLFFNADLDGDGDGFDVLGSGDGVLTPANSAGGSVPATVITDANGIGTFEVAYLKNFASWIDTEITATTLVSGTETRGVRSVKLNDLISDRTPCTLDPSPFNPTSVGASTNTIGMSAAGIGVMASLEQVVIGGTSTITVKVVDSNLADVGTATVTFALETQGSDDGTTAPSLLSATKVTGLDGTTTNTYTAGGKAGLDIIKVSVTVSGVTYVNRIRINVI